MSSGKSVIIIGSGLGGLECGVILARHGFKVIVLEQDRQIGGCLQTFVRKGSFSSFFAKLNENGYTIHK